MVVQTVVYSLHASPHYVAVSHHLRLHCFQYRRHILESAFTDFETPQLAAEDI